MYRSSGATKDSGTIKLLPNLRGIMSRIHFSVPDAEFRLIFLSFHIVNIGHEKNLADGQVLA
jgi:hypothetical protein